VYGPGPQGGSTGLLGQGANGAAGTISGGQGNGGGGGSSGVSGGTTTASVNNAPDADSNAHGAGAGGGAIRYNFCTGALLGITAGGAGGPGAVRIIWGAGRAYPSTNTGNV
jgi:hypothetical protein